LKATDRELLSNILARAERTLSTRVAGGGGDPEVATEIRDTLSELRREINKETSSPSTRIAPSLPSQPRPKDPEDVFLNYGQNPTITTTALAHHLWRHVLRPGIDSAIDATAGNGGDSVVLARMLFLDGETAVDGPTQSQIVSVDIQEEACENTRRKLQSLLPDELMEQNNNVRIVHGSHAPLPLPERSDSIAIVVYNLGYLPNSSKEFLTQTQSTLTSLTGAIRALRVGGMLSVMTYPRSNKQEDWAVHVFLEGLALFTSAIDDWREYVDTVDIPTSVKEQELVDTRQTVRDALDLVWNDRSPKETWRVHEYRKLGWKDAPILLAAVRIK